MYGLQNDADPTITRGRQWDTGWWNLMAFGNGLREDRTSRRWRQAVGIRRIDK